MPLAWEGMFRTVMRKWNEMKARNGGMCLKSQVVQRLGPERRWKPGVQGQPRQYSKRWQEAGAGRGGKEKGKANEREGREEEGEEEEKRRSEKERLKRKGRKRKIPVGLLWLLSPKQNKNYGREPGIMLLHTCHPGTLKPRQEDHCKCKMSLDYDFMFSWIFFFILIS